MEPKRRTCEHQCSIWVRRSFPNHKHPFPYYTLDAQDNHALLSQSTRIRASFYANKRDRSTRRAVLLRKDAVSRELEGTPVLRPACFPKFTPRLDHSASAFDLGHRNNQTYTVRRGADHQQASYGTMVRPLNYSNRSRPGIHSTQVTSSG